MATWHFRSLVLTKVSIQIGVYWSLRTNETRMYQIVGSMSENLGMIQRIVQIIPEQMQVFRLIRQTNWINIESSHLSRSKQARMEPAITHVHLPRNLRTLQQLGQPNLLAHIHIRESM